MGSHAPDSMYTDLGASFFTSSDFVLEITDSHCDGARAVVLRAKREGSYLGQWMKGLEGRAARNVVIVATANKLARGRLGRVIERRKLSPNAEVYACQLDEVTLKFGSHSPGLTRRCWDLPEDPAGLATRPPKAGEQQPASVLLSYNLLILGTGSASPSIVCSGGRLPGSNRLVASMGWKRLSTWAADIIGIDAPNRSGRFAL